MPINIYRYLFIHAGSSTCLECLSVTQLGVSIELYLFSHVCCVLAILLGIISDLLLSINRYLLCSKFNTFTHIFYEMSE